MHFYGVITADNRHLRAYLTIDNRIVAFPLTMNQSQMFVIVSVGHETDGAKTEQNAMCPRSS